MTTGLAVIMMVLFAPVEIYIYLTKGEDAWFDFMTNIIGSFTCVLESLLGG